MSEDNVILGKEEARRKLHSIKNILLVGSGKGGVGKSFVASSLALVLSNRKFKTGIIDLDIHGASIPSSLNLKGPLKSSSRGLEPKTIGSLKVMSIGLLTGEKPIPLRGGAPKDSLITQFFVLTNWGTLDYLVVDLPPGTGDEVLSAFSLFGQRARLILVTTPSPNAVSIVSRLAELARIESIRIEGTVVNMSFISRGESRVYPFGKITTRELEKRLKSRVLGEIPLEPRVSSSDLQNLLGGRSNVIQNAMGKIVDTIQTKSNAFG
jgi:ATP-binding protein involved in chromosome partitioning